jgi:hypothetical protein
MPAVVRNVGTARSTKNVDGETVYREEQIYLPSHQQWYSMLDTDNHFIYKSRRIGASVLCTCGSPAITVSYPTYRKLSSFIGLEILVCQSLITNGKHADGST